MTYFFVILIIVLVLLFGYYTFRCVREEKKVSFRGFLLFYKELLSKNKLDTGSKAKYQALNDKYQIALQDIKRLGKELDNSEVEWRLKIEKLTQELKSVQIDRSNLVAQNTNLLRQNSSLKNVARKLFPVSENKVSEPYCHYFNSIERILFDFYQETVEQVIDTPGSDVSHEIESLVAYVKTENALNKSMVKDWHILLSVSSAVTAEAARDIEYKDDAEVLNYLQRVSFEHYFRPRISSLLYFAETVRMKKEGCLEGRMSIIIKNYLEMLCSCGIEVVYCKSGDQLDCVDFSNFEIVVPEMREMTIENLAPNTITKVIKYGINSSRLDCVSDKTIVEMVI